VSALGHLGMSVNDVSIGDLIETIKTDERESPQEA